MGLRTRIMSTVWTAIACEAGREERGPKMREPLPFDLHWSNLEEERKREKEEGRKRGRGDEKGITMCPVC